MIHLNIKQELNNWAYMQLLNAGFNNIVPDKALEQYYDVALRIITSKPRRIKKTKEFCCPAGYEHKLQCIENAVAKGVNLGSFMTKRMLNAAYQDKMLFDWGIYHFHLSDTIDAKDKRFMARSGQLLIAYKDFYDDDTIYFITIVSHQKINLWTTQDFIRSLADNWPDMMEKYRMQGVTATDFAVTDGEYATLRSANINSSIDLGDGRVYISPNLGLTAAGTSLRAQFELITMIRHARLLEEQIQTKSAEIIYKINEYAETTLNDITLRLQTFRNNDFAFILEEEPNIQLLAGLDQTNDGYFLHYIIICHEGINEIFKKSVF